MDASGYNMSFDKEQLALLCANYDRRIDSLGAENKRLKAENATLRELAWTLANCAAGHGCDYCPINGGYGYVGELDMCESVHANMRELGMEAE